LAVSIASRATSLYIARLIELLDDEPVPLHADIFFPARDVPRAQFVPPFYEFAYKGASARKRASSDNVLFLWELILNFVN